MKTNIESYAQMRVSKIKSLRKLIFPFISIFLFIILNIKYLYFSVIIKPMQKYFKSKVRGIKSLRKKVYFAALRVLENFSWGY